MRFRLPARIAWRYLFSRKSHSAVTAITGVSVAGVAVATAALVCVLSVFNGFRSVLSGKLDQLDPDVIVQPARGKTIAEADTLAARIRNMKGVAVAMPSVTDNALAFMNGVEIPVTLKGVAEADYRRLTSIDSILAPGSVFSLTSQEMRGGEQVWDDEMQEWVEADASPLHQAVIAIGVANRIMDLRGNMTVFAPRRKGRVNLANPATSFQLDSLPIAGVWQAQQAAFDKDMVITDISVARNLFEYTDEATAIEIKATPGTDATELAHTLAQTLGPDFTVKDRLEQHQLNFRMINIEKWVTFLLLAFILLIASFNLISTLSMLILEKQNSLGTLRALGATRRRIGAIFAWESVYVTLLGCGTGIVLGLVLCLVQQEFGLIKLNGDASRLLMAAYPVEVRWGDLLWVLAPIAVVGGITAAISYGFAKGRSLH